MRSSLLDQGHRQVLRLPRLGFGYRGGPSPPGLHCQPLVGMAIVLVCPGHHVLGAVRGGP